MAKANRKPTRVTAKNSEGTAKSFDGDSGYSDLLHKPKYSLFEVVVFSVGTLFVWFLLRRFAQRFRSRKISESGYVLIYGQFEHRLIAQKVLGRNLVPGEVVHHINGRKRDNNEYNLCVMDQYAHEDFHRWLNWRFEKDGRYPTIPYQRAVLRDRYQGTLLVTSPDDLPALENDYEQKQSGGG